jgi:hypothetical protein
MRNDESDRHEIINDNVLAVLWMNEYSRTTTGLTNHHAVRKYYKIWEKKKQKNRRKEKKGKVKHGGHPIHSSQEPL